MEQQPDNNQILHVYNGYFVEFMTTTLNRHIFNLISFLQVILSSAVMADVSHTFMVGLLFAILSGFLFVYKPGEKASQAKNQARRYERLLHRLDTIDRQELKALLGEYVEHDSDVFGPLIRPAHIRALIARGTGDDEIKIELSRLTKVERFFAWCAGGIPI